MRTAAGTEKEPGEERRGRKEGRANRNTRTGTGKAAGDWQLGRRN